jgi:hypothetical protein
MSSRSTRTALVLLAAVAAMFAGAGVARADGDPASDVLYTGRAFFPYSTTISKSAQETLVGTIGAAEKADYPIRVALIAGPVDLGAVTVLWAKPKKYAMFLGLELSFVYKGPLLIVMPSGFGFEHYKQNTKAEYAALSNVRILGRRDGLALSAVEAVKVLAARAGHPIERPGSSSSGSSASRVLAGTIALAVLLLSAGGIIVVRRLRTAGRRS